MHAVVRVAVLRVEVDRDRVRQLDLRLAVADVIEHDVPRVRLLRERLPAGPVRKEMVDEVQLRVTTTAIFVARELPNRRVLVRQNSSRMR